MNIFFYLPKKIYAQCNTDKSDTFQLDIPFEGEVIPAVSRLM